MVEGVGTATREENDVWEGRGWGWYRVGSSDRGAADFLAQDQFKAVRPRTGRIRRDGLELLPVRLPPLQAVQPAFEGNCTGMIAKDMKLTGNDAQSHEHALAHAVQTVNGRAYFWDRYGAAREKELQAMALL